MEFRVLKYFLVTAQEGNMTRAAEVLMTTQSNLSKQLTALEDSLGKQLFLREGRRLVLTEEGMYLRKRAKEIIELAERTESEIMGYEDEVSGVVHIGAAETRVMYKLAGSMIKAREQYPEITFDILSGSTAEVSEMVDKGLLDFALMVSPIDTGKYDYLELPYKEKTGLLMRRDHPLAEKKVIRPEDIKNEPVLTAHQQLDGNTLAGWLGRDMHSLNIVSTFNLITNPSMMVEAGLGSAFTLEDLVRTDESSVLCFRPLSPAVEAGFYLYWKKYQIFTRAAEAFLKVMQEDMI